MDAVRSLGESVEEFAARMERLVARRYAAEATELLARQKLATIINYIDRSAINIMWPYIYKEFGIADADNKNALALITTFFMVAYAIGQTLTGKMMDAIGTRLGMVFPLSDGVFLLPYMQWQGH